MTRSKLRPPAKPTRILINSSAFLRRLAIGFGSEKKYPRAASSLEPLPLILRLVFLSHEIKYAAATCAEPHTQRLYRLFPEASLCRNVLSTLAFFFFFSFYFFIKISRHGNNDVWRRSASRI